MAKCLVLGGDGFIGSQLAAKLVSLGHDVTIFGRRYNPVDFNTNVRYIYGDFLNSTDISEATVGQEYVFHFITLTNPAISERDPYIDIETNVKMTIQLLERCVENKVKRVIFPSSGGAIYGNSDRETYTEDDLTQPVSPYAIGKQTIEGYLRFFNHKYGLDYLNLRLSNVYGPGQHTSGKKHGVIPVFIGNMISQSEINIFGDGSMVRDYIYISDLVKVISEISFKEMNYKTYNVGSGIGVSVNEIISEIENTLKIKAKKTYLETPSTYIDKIVLDCTRLKNEIGNFSETVLSKGVEHVYQSLKSG